MSDTDDAQAGSTGAVLIADTQSILEDWEKQVRAQLPEDAGEHPSYLLRNNLPQLLAIISVALNRGDADLPGEPLADVARAHVRERMSMSTYSFDSILREYSFLREVLLTHLDQKIHVSLKDRLIINRCIDLAMHQTAEEFMAETTRLQQELSAERGRLNSLLRAEHRQLEAILDQMPVGVAIAERPGGRLIYHNKALERGFGHVLLPSETYEEYTQYGGIHEDGSPLTAEDYPMTRAVAWGEVVQDQEVLYRRDDGSLALFSVSAAPIDEEDGTNDVAVSVFVDITELKRIQAALEQKKEQAQITLRAINDGVITTDRSGRIERLNPAAERLTGWNGEAVEGQPVKEIIELLDERDGKSIEFPLSQAIGRNTLVELKSHVLLRSKQGRLLPATITVAPTHDAEGEIVGSVTIVHDATEERRLLLELSRDATQDALTGLLNRREFERRLQRTVEDARQGGLPAVLMFLDLDRFKIINDTCGHAAGDQLLCQLANLFREHLRERDTLARLGGDEFAIILEHCQISQALPIANEIREAVSNFSFGCANQVFSVGVSIGLSAIDQSAPNVKRVKKMADQACYAAKEAGRNRVCVGGETESGPQLAPAGTNWPNVLEQALVNNRFVLFGQRIRPLSDQAGQGDCLEILLRLCAADGTLMEPGMFMPSAERYDLMPEIDRWVVSCVLQWMTDHAQEIQNLQFCTINLSPQTLAEESSCQRLVDMLRDTPVDPAKLCFEMSESAVASHLRQASWLISALREQGYRVVLEDVGVGLASFRNLRQMPADFFKIDGSFVENMLASSEDQAILRSLNEVCHILGKQTIAKFVNEEPVMHQLADIGVDFAQGYFVAPPLRLDRVLAEV